MEPSDKTSEGVRMAGTIALLQARIRSNRLPGKVLMSLQGKAVIEIMLARLKRSQELDAVVLVTSTEPENDALAYVAEQHNIPCFRGSEKDVLDRYYQAALFYKVEHIVRLTGDCPLIDWELIDEMIGFYHQCGVDYVKTENFPDGLCASVFSFEALESAWKNATLPSEREHVTPWILKHTQQNGHNLFKALDYSCAENLSDERWTIDAAADYIFLQELAKALPTPLVNATWQDILRTVKAHPEIKAINAHIPRDEGYQKSLEEDKKACL